MPQAMASPALSWINVPEGARSSPSRTVALSPQHSNLPAWVRPQAKSRLVAIALKANLAGCRRSSPPPQHTARPDLRSPQAYREPAEIWRYRLLSGTATSPLF